MAEAKAEAERAAVVTRAGAAARPAGEVVLVVVLGTAGDRIPCKVRPTRGWSSRHSCLPSRSTRCPHYSRCGGRGSPWCTTIGWMQMAAVRCKNRRCLFVCNRHLIPAPSQLQPRGTPPLSGTRRTERAAGTVVTDRRTACTGRRRSCSQCSGSPHRSCPPVRAHAAVVRRSSHSRQRRIASA